MTGISRRESRPLVSRRQTRAFSLIELMVVMAVIAIMVAAGATIFKSGGQELSASVAKVASTLSMARELAITQNCRTRFFITTSPDDWKYHRYGILRVPADTPDTGEKDTPFQLYANLEELDSGIYFQKNTHNEGETYTDGSDMFDGQSSGTMQMQNKAGVDYSYIEFLPTGGTARKGTANIFEIEKAPDASHRISGNQNYVRMGVAQYTGRVKFQRPTAKN